MVKRTTRALSVVLLCASCCLNEIRSLTGPGQDAFAAPFEAHAAVAKKQWGVNRIARRQSSGTMTVDSPPLYVEREEAVKTWGSAVSLGLFCSAWLGVFSSSMGAMYGAQAGRFGLIGMAAMLALGVGTAPLMARIKKSLVPWADNKVALGEVAQQSAVEDPTLKAVLREGLLLLAAIGVGLGFYGGMALALKGVVGVAGLYAIMSFNEYVVHRYYQHLGINKVKLYRYLRTKRGFPLIKSSGHVEHHKETKDDMTLDRRPDPILDPDPFRGTAFSWDVTGSMMAQVAIQSFPFLWLCGWSLPASSVAFVVAMMAHAMVWQTLHPAMHLLPDPPMLYGVPGWSLTKLRNTKFFRFLYVNHEGHHRYPGAHGNYNVCCPLFDHIMGTYRGVIPPQAA